jgi:hypothetical protein
MKAEHIFRLGIHIYVTLSRDQHPFKAILFGAIINKIAKGALSVWTYALTS